MDPAGRLFLCARCRVQVVLCSRCDRGNRYCGRPCWRLAHDAARRDSAGRYQRSRRGRLVHAERSRRWRQRRDARDAGDGGDTGEHGQDGGGHEQNVTHQGCPPGPVAAPLVACTPHTTSASAPAYAAASTVTAVTATVTTTTSTAWLCRRCARQQPAGVRQGFLRHGLRPGPQSSRPGWHHDHSP